MTGPAPLSALALRAMALGGGHPSGTSLIYREARWSYRRPISYLLVNAAGEQIGDIAPVDGTTRTASHLSVMGQPVLVLIGDRRGNMAVADLAGAPLGSFRRRPALMAVRLDLVVANILVARLTQKTLSSRPVELQRPDGALIAWLHRSGGRFAGADVSRLDLSPAATSIPGPLLLAAVPALDALRKAIRSA